MSVGPGPTLSGSLVAGPNSSPSTAADANGDVTDPDCPGNGNGGGGGNNGGGPPPTCSAPGGSAGGGGFGAPTAGFASPGGGSGSGSSAAGSFSFDTASADSSGFGAPSSGGGMSGLTLSGFGGGAPWGAPSSTGALSGGSSGGGSGSGSQTLNAFRQRLSKNTFAGGGGGGSGAAGLALALIFEAATDVPCWTSTGVQGGCVAPATRIALFPQGCKAAGEMEVGDLLLTRTPEGELVGERVKGIRRSIQPCVLIQTEDARTLHCSLSHEVMIWDARQECARRVRVSELTPSDRVILEEGSSVGIKALTPQSEGPVLLLSLCGPHHYYLSEGLWSHNAIKTYAWP